jgi:hypothetical protein
VADADPAFRSVALFDRALHAFQPYRDPQVSRASGTR